MKKLSIIVILLSILFIFNNTRAVASDLDSNIYTIKEMELSVSIPDDSIVFTRNIDVNDPNLALLGVDGDTLRQILIQRNCYFDVVLRGDTYAEVGFGQVIDTTGSYDLKQVRDKYSEINKIFSDETDTIFQSMKDGGTAQDIPVEYTSYTMYEHPQALFFQIDGSMEYQGQQYNLLRYITIINGNMVSIDLSSIGTPITDNQRTIIKNIIDSIHFDEVKEIPAEKLRIMEDNMGNNGVDLLGNIFEILGFLTIPIIIVIIVIIVIKTKKKKQNNEQKQD
jgi:hypothetical protein